MLPLTAGMVTERLIFTGARQLLPGDLGIL